MRKRNYYDWLISDFYFIYFVIYIFTKKRKCKMQRRKSFFNNEMEQRFSLRKYTIGLCSVCLGLITLGMGSQTVKADAINGAEESSVVQENKTQDTTPANNAVSAETKTNTSDSVAVKPNNTALTDTKQNKAGSAVVKPNTADSATLTVVKPSETKFAKPVAAKVFAESKVATNNQFNPANSRAVDVKEIAESKVEKTYNADINAWTGHDDGTYYVLDKYTPQNDAEKDLIVIPNEADFEKAGKSTNGHEVGIPSYTVKNFMSSVNPKEVHFSETNGKKIKAIHEANNWFDWETSFGHSTNFKAITGTSFDVTEFNNISLSGLFQFDPSLTDISAVASWQFKPQYIPNMFQGDSSLTDLSPLSNWDISNVTNLGHTFNGCTNLTNIDTLRNWNTSKVLYWDNMFRDCPNLTNINAINNWNYSSASVNTQFGNYPLDDMFYGDHKIQINIGTDSGLADFIRRTGRIDAFHNSSNQISTSNTKLIELLTNTNFQAQNETTTAKRTITFSGLPANRAIPPIVQVINYTKLAAAIVDMTGTSDSNAHGKIVSSGFEKDWQLDTSKQNDAIIVNGQVHFKPVKIPHVNGYKAHLVRNKLNPAMFMVSFVAVPTVNKLSLSDKVTPAKPSVSTANPNKPSNDLQQRVVTKLNLNDSGWTMSTDGLTYKVEVLVNDITIDLSDLLIAQPVHAQTRTRIRVNKRFKLRKHGKKHAVKHLKHRKKAVKSFKKYRL